MKLWSQLAETTRKRYRAQGITGARYNAWNKTKRGNKAKLETKGVSREAFLKAPSTRTAVRNAAEQRAYEHLTTLLDNGGFFHSTHTISRGVSLMTPRELNGVPRLTLDQYRRLASHAPDERLYNPYWYK